MSSYNALILAGARSTGDPLARHSGVSSKALVEIGRMPMLARVVAALRLTDVGRIAVSCSDPEVASLARSLGCEVFAAAAGPSQSAMAGLRRLGTPMLLTTADHALLQPEWVQHFVDAQEPGVDVSALLARRETIEGVVPETRRTYLRFADGQWSGCNLFYFSRPGAIAALALWRRLEADRKHPLRLVRRLGPTFLLRYLLGRLTIQDALDELARQAGLTARVVESPYGLAAVDIDTPADLALGRRLADDLASQPLASGKCA